MLGACIKKVQAPDREWTRDAGGGLGLVFHALGWRRADPRRQLCTTAGIKSCGSSRALELSEIKCGMDSLFER